MGFVECTLGPTLQYTKIGPMVGCLAPQRWRTIVSGPSFWVPLLGILRFQTFRHSARPTWKVNMGHVQISALFKGPPLRFHVRVAVCRHCVRGRFKWHGDAELDQTLLTRAMVFLRLIEITPPPKQIRRHSANHSKNHTAHANNGSPRSRTCACEELASDHGTEPIVRHATICAE